MTGRFKARPTVYKGIEMRSRLEAGFAAWLDSWLIKWEYEPRAYASEDGQYLPDFEIRAGIKMADSWSDVDKIFFEVKPSKPDLDLLEAQGRILGESEPNCALFAVWPEGDGYGMHWSWFGRSEEGRCAFTYEVVRPKDMHLYPGLRSSGEILVIALLPDSSPWRGDYWKPGT